MDKHAYLIIAHKYDYTLECLLKLLDDKRNDIYIHMDKKNKKYNENDVIKLLSNSNIYFTKRTSVTWGSYSLVNAKLLLLEKAIENGHYSYYHIVSGEDLPIKSQNYIHAFFKKNQGLEFVDFQSKKFLFESRIKYYYPFREKIGRKKNFYIILERLLVKIQKIFNYSRKKTKYITFQKGSNWCSITDSFARYVVFQKTMIKKVFKNTFMCDELVFQTLIMNSKFKNKIFYNGFDNSMISNMRLIDWKRGNPYVFKNEDYNELISSQMIFARKFDYQVDNEIIDNIYNYVKSQK